MVECVDIGLNFVADFIRQLLCHFLLANVGLGAEYLLEEGQDVVFLELLTAQLPDDMIFDLLNDLSLHNFQTSLKIFKLRALI